MVDKVLVISRNTLEPPQAAIFQSGSFWKFLHPNDNEPVVDPTRGKEVHAPTDTTMVKPDVFNYSVRFGHPPFVKKVDVLKLSRFGK